MSPRQVIHASVLCPVLCPLIALAPAARAADLGVISTLAPSSNPAPCAVAYDASIGALFAYDCAAGAINRYDSIGALQGSIDVSSLAPTSSVALDMMYGQVDFGGVETPERTLIWINSTAGTTAIHAFDPDSGALIATLNTVAEYTHVVGLTFNQATGTIFLLQNQHAAPGQANTVTEIDPETGAAIGSFSISASGLTIEEGAISAADTGDLFLLSSVGSSMAKFTPGGTLRYTLALPSAVSNASGLSIVGVAAQSWISGMDGHIWQIDGPTVLTCAQDYNDDDLVDVLDLLDFLDDFGACAGFPAPCGVYGDPDQYNPDGQVDIIDFLAFFDVFGQTCGF